MPKRKNCGTAAKKNVGEVAARKKLLDDILRQFDKDAEAWQHQKQREIDQTAASIEGIFKMWLFRMSAAEKSTKWESHYRSWCGVAGENQDKVRQASDVGCDVSYFRLPDPPQSSTPAPASMTVAALLQAKRGTRLGTVAPPCSTIMATPLLPPQPLEASTPLVRAKFDPATVLKKAPTSVRRFRPNELLMSLHGSPVVTAEADSVSGAGEEVQRTRQNSRVPGSSRQQTLAAVTQLLACEGDRIHQDAEERQLLKQLRDQLNSLPSLSS